MLFYLSLIVARMCYFALQVTKLSSGTAFIGLIVLKICPDFLKYANKYVTKSKINITGTNGKTTTSAITAHVLKKLNKDIIYNSTGANMLTGVVNSMSLQINPFKPSEYSVIEADEAHLGKIYDKFSADYLLVTNLFEDQLDRYGSLENTRNLIQKAIDKNPDLQLILNADDPFIVTMKSNKEPVFYGVESVTYDEGVNFTDSTNLNNNINTV
ncbi:MAG: hypothetical protein MJ231_08440, partial [bacterium]|nr:hypothetical protein [bacterium]